jgi:hypothetical protein
MDELCKLQPWYRSWWALKEKSQTGCPRLSAAPVNNKAASQYPTRVDLQITSGGCAHDQKISMADQAIFYSGLWHCFLPNMYDNFYIVKVSPKDNP